MLRRTLAFSVLILLACTSLLRAQQRDPIVTDRPDQTESAAIVPAGWLQIEAGVTYEEGAASYLGYDHASHWTTQLPAMLLRLGVNDRFELRVGAALTRMVSTFRDGPLNQTGAVWPDVHTDTLGFEPFSLGMKAALSEEDGLIPQAAVIVTVGIPGLGADWFDIRWPAPEIRLAFAHTLSDVFSLGYNLGIAWDGSWSPVHAGYYSLVLGAGVTERIGAYAELYGDLPGDMPALHRADAGLTFLLNPDLQLDLSAGMALNEPDVRIAHYRMDSFAGLGVSWRVPLFADAQ
jgi:hypothetical protein